MSSRKGSSKRNSSSHSSSGDEGVQCSARRKFPGVRISHFKAEEAERELFQFWKEVEEQSRRQAELHSRALVRAERRGKRAIVAEMKQRAALFATKFESFKDAQEFVGDFASAMARLLPSTSRRTRTSLFLLRSLRCRVSENTAEAGTSVGDEGAGVADGEVDQPASSQSVAVFDLCVLWPCEAMTGFRARPRFTFGSKAVRRLIGSRFACGRFPPEFVGDFRECRGSVATLYKSQNEDFSFPAEVAEMSGLMNGCAHAESLVPPIEGRVRQLWDSIAVSEDTVEAGTGVCDEGAGVADGEVDQPVSSFGISMSGFLDFEL
ncbi:hypothetical protein DY000_02012981 [Brassica cretica]|uniref:Uncharacterized protein n=1 Tax=Brassica cretica TaxID=69181 RepID=A0ABQ7D421_BRACR|nr:hypothetical protein DY000_02012981 [Brassica cretica]